MPVTLHGVASNTCACAVAPKSRRTQGYTPLHFAAFHGDHPAVSRIIAAAVERSADVILEEGERTVLERLLDTRSHEGECPVDVARRRGHAAIAEALVKASKKPADGNDGSGSAGEAPCVRS